MAQDLTPQQEQLKFESDLLKEKDELSFKRDCRKTALQLSSRITSIPPEGALKEANLMYDWLISAGDVEKEKYWMDKFGQSEEIK